MGTVEIGIDKYDKLILKEFIFDKLCDIILNSAELNFSGDGLNFFISDQIKALCPKIYEERLNELKGKAKPDV